MERDEVRPGNNVKAAVEGGETEAEPTVPEITLGIRRPEEIVHRRKIATKKEQVTQRKDSRFCRGSCRQRFGRGS